MEVKHRRKNHPMKLVVNMAEKAASNDVTLTFDDHQQSISEGIQRLFDSKCLLDVDVDCGGEVVAAHKLILGIFCPVLLQSLQQQHPQDHVKQRINVDSRLQHIEYLIKFLYYGQVTLPKSHLKELYKVAEKLGVQGLVDAIQKLKGKCRLKKTDREKVRQEEDKSKQKEGETSFNQVKGRKRKKTVMKLSESEIEESNSELDKKSDTIDVTKSQLGLRNRTVTRSKESTSGVTYKKKKRQTSVMKCSFCDYETKDKNSFKSHLAEHHGSELVCKVCSKTFRTKQGFRFHLRGHENREPFKCTHCTFSTLYKHKWLQHLAAIHKVDPDGNPLAESFRCTECDYVCVADHQLKAHIIRKHKAGRPFKCNECNYAAVIRYELEKHIKIVHRRERPHMCDECGFQSQTVSGLKRHKRLHTGVKPFKCDICGQAYADNHKLKTHLLRHVNDDKPFVCHLCGQSCRRRDSFKIHLKNVHQTTMDGNAELHTSSTAPNSSVASPPMVTPSSESVLVICNPVGNFQIVNFEVEDASAKTPPSSPERILALC